MAANVTSLVRILGGYKDEVVVCCLNSQELDLDMKMPDGWEKRLDLKVSLFGIIMVSFIFSGNFLDSLYFRFSRYK